MILDKEAEMEITGNLTADGEKSVSQQKLTPRASSWFWRPWYAKLLWGGAAVYWVSLYGLMLSPVDSIGSTVPGLMILLVFLFNPITVIAILGFGYLKAKVACGDWVVSPGVPPEIAEWQRREREAAYFNPVDIRSGYLHQQYMDRSRRHPTGHADS